MSKYKLQCTRYFLLLNIPEITFKISIQTRAFEVNKSDRIPIPDELSILILKKNKRNLKGVTCWLDVPWEEAVGIPISHTTK